ncbi:hypothetical protein [Lysinibacillus capsici]|uniref:hypothetical protein n=1 Tax=Lysinibacillus capsici TaxID=2115968 RepID=UPI0034E5D53F
MNLAMISEEFREQIAAITAGTRYEISSKSDNDVPVMKHGSVTPCIACGRMRHQKR